jgi:uncharacterized protein DUF222/HNH endonuclease
MDSTIVAGQASDARRCPLELLEREITELAAHVHAGMCRWLELVGEFDRREGWAEWGCRSCAQWLSHTCALGPIAAREHVRVARRLGELPVIRAAFAQGELSYSQVRALTRVATGELEAQLLELARHATAAQLEQTLRAYRGVLRRELTAEDAAHGDRYVVCEYDEDGSLLLRGRLPAEEGALVLKALEAGRDALRAAGDAEEPSTDEPSSEGRDVSAETEVPADRETSGDASNAAALVLMAETLLDAGPAERSTADSYQVVVHVDTASLSADETDDAACQLDDGPLLHPETARRLACDSSLVRILERDGRPLSVGRRTRSIPPALRRALQSRDRCCRFPGCTQRRHLNAHHIDHWAQGGRTDLSNLVQLCRFHHRLLHEGGYTLERAGRHGELRFRRPDGRALPDVPSPPGGRVDGLQSRNAARGVEVAPDTCASEWLGDRLDLGLAIDALVANDPRLEEPE